MRALWLLLVLGGCQRKDQKWAPASRCSENSRWCNERCLPKWICCGQSECATPLDKCHVAQGAECNGALCLYPPVRCSASQVCVEGSCQASPLKFTITPKQSTLPWQDESMFWTGHVKFDASLTNISAQPITLSA